MVGPIDMQSVILNSYTQSSVNNNLLLQATQADNAIRIAQKKQEEEKSAKVESAKESQNPDIHTHLSKKDSYKNQNNSPKHLDIKV